MRPGYIRSQTRVLLISIFKYRSRFAITFIGQLVLPVIFNSIFLFALSETETSIDRLALFQYVLLSNMLFTISFSNVENELSSDIRTSRLNYKLLAPQNTLLQYFLKSIINKFFLITIFYLPFLIIFSLIRRQNLSTLVQAVPLLLISVIVGYCLSIIIGIAAFWLTEIWGLSAVKNLALSLFSGALFPLSLLPENIYRSLAFLPFPYVSYYPASTVLDDTTFVSLKTIGVGVLWCVLLITVVLSMWKSGLKKFEGYSV